MEALAALGLAANIAQFLELGTKIFKNVVISPRGGVVSASELSSLAADLNHLSLRLKDEHTTAPASDLEAQALCDLAAKCSDAAAELTGILHKVLRFYPKMTRWDSTVAALRMIWQQDQIKMLVERLAEYRSQLTLRLLMVLNKRQREDLQAMRDEIVEVLSVNIRSVAGRFIREDAETVATPGDRGKFSRLEEDQPFAAVFKTRSGSSTAIGPPSGLSPTESLERASLPRMSITYSTDTNANGPDTPGVFSFRTSSDVHNYEQKILDALHFRGLSERQSRIDPAYARTFEWMWDGSSHPDFKDVRWDPLGSWLRDKSPAKGRCYWVQGKAGSGKSSLIKYAQQDTRLARYLGTWAGSAQLVIPSFYFWYAGSELQRSHAGLLRALLFGILMKRPELAPVLFPDICRVIISGELTGSLMLSLWELKAAFSNLVQSVPDDLRICFVVDGIDEYTGDYNELCELLLRATESTSIKVLASSRPIPSCCDKFRHSPTLRLQDLTRHDIHRYVRGNLADHPLMVKMEKAEPGVTKKITDEVVDRASGIFLWVVLVVRNLISRLQSYTLSSTTLLEEVSRLPPDLEKLYAHMLGSISKQNQILGSKFLQLLFRQMEIGGRFDFTLLQVSFAVECDYEACLNSPFEPLTREAREWRCEATEGRLRASCCGLCEVQTSNLGLIPCVSFIHRTVVEFLQLDAVRKKVTSLTSKPPSRDSYSSEREFGDDLAMFKLHSNFDADLALLSSSISELKAMTPQPWHFESDRHIIPRMLRVLGYEKHLREPIRLAYHTKYLDEMRRALTYHRHDAQLFSNPQEELAAVDSAYDRARRQLQLDYPHSVLFALNIQPANPRVYKHIYGDQQEEHRGTAYLMIRMVDEPQGRVRMLMANSIVESQTHPALPISIPTGPAKKLWNDRWKQAVHPEASRPWSLLEFMLHYCYSVMNDTEDRRASFSVPEYSHSFLIVIDSLLHSTNEGPPQKDDESDKTTIIVGTGLAGWKKQRLTARSVIIPMLYMIWSKVGSYPDLDKSKVANKCTQIARSLASFRRTEQDGNERRNPGQGVAVRGIASKITAAITGTGGLPISSKQLAPSQGPETTPPWLAFIYRQGAT